MAESFSYVSLQFIKFGLWHPTSETPVYEKILRAFSHSNSPDTFCSAAYLVAYGADQCFFVTYPSQWCYSLGVHLGTNAGAFRYLYGSLYDLRHT